MVVVNHLLQLFKIYTHQTNAQLIFTTGKMSLPNVHDNNKTSQIPLDVQLQLCREVARAFGHLCKAVCKKFGKEGEEVVRETFFSNDYLCNREAPPHVENFPRELSTTLIKLLASWGINSGSHLESISTNNRNT